MSKSRGGFVVTPPYYVTRRGQKEYRQFIGKRPVSPCNALYNNPRDCKRHRDPPDNCRWIEDVSGRLYCRGPPGSVSAKYPAGQTVRYLPAYKGAINPCLWQPQDVCEDLKRQGKCQWIEQSKRNRAFCRSYPGTNVPRSSPYILAQREKERGGRQQQQRAHDGTDRHPLRYGNNGRADRDRDEAKRERDQLFTGSGAFRSYRISQEEKDAWYPPPLPPDFDDDVLKYCHCVLELGAEDEFLQATTPPYAICNASISESHGKTRQQQEEIASKLAVMSFSGACTKYADFDSFNTYILYSYAKQRQNTAKGSQFFADLPSFEDFIRDPQSYRQDLLERVHAYQDLELGTRR